MFTRYLEFMENSALREKLEKMNLEVSSKGLSYCKAQSGDFILLKNDVPMDDLNNPREAIRQMLKNTIKTPMAKNDIIIAFGLGMCYLLDEIYNKYPSRIYIYEPDINVMHFVLSNVDISDHLASGRVFITSDLDELMNKISSDYLTKDKVEIVYLKNYAVVKNQELLQLTQKVYDTCKSKMIDINTITRFSKVWLFNTLKNISEINKSSVFKLSDLENKFTGQTALILAAGPSLSENIEKIKANRDKYVIFAVNKVLRVLSANGIIPDFAVCLDGVAVESTLTGLEDYCSNINCIADLRTDNVIYSKPFKKIFVTFSQSDFLVKKLAEYNNFIQAYECGGSATTLAMVAAVKLGFGKIIFSGLDMAFKDDVIYSTGETYDKLSDAKIKINSVEKNLVKVKSVTGAMVDTRDDYASFIRHFEVLIKDLGNPEIYNTTSFGAMIEGMKNVPFDGIPLMLPASGVQMILDLAVPFKFEIKEWTQEELHAINNTIAILSKGVFSPALVASIVKSSLMYQYMQADILKILQSKFAPEMAEAFIETTKNAVKSVVEALQKNYLI